MLFHNDNVPAHTSHDAMVAVHECGFELLSQPPSDFQLSRDLNESLHGRAFVDNKTVIMAINQRIEEQDQNFFCERITALQQRWEKCVDLRRNYVLK